ncbi:hypothetical protein M0R89_20575 (plasmid) [Halorussus limi]|uniref:Uncharacterized protein n=1 Tax=Halorussus limi TaxID=2938695 RepID=A0A8U0I1R8_9EURY|nr:hypothetical protein [Halorussus limi]UPV76866.1 hypothetical protein M0R89_20575 [Halorussus limi]
MTDGRPDAARSGAVRGGGATRRGFLALAGTATLAGCNGFGGIGGVFGDEPPTLSGEAIGEAVSADPPTVPETVPIPVEQSRLDETAAAVRDRLDSVPAPFDAREIPNGAIRDKVSQMRDEATTALEDAADAPTPVETMTKLRTARGRAREVTATWAAIDAGLGFADLRETVPEIRDATDAFRGRWRYVGDAPIRAVLAHAKIEELVAFVGHRTGGAVERYGREAENPIRTGEFAGALEEARAALDDAEYLYDRYESSLADPRRVRSEVTAAGESLIQTLENRREKLPDGNPRKPSSFVDRNIKRTPVGSAMTELYRGLDYADGLEDERATGRRAQVVVSAHETLVRVRAFELLRERVQSGDHVTVESADDVRKIRESAIRAFEDALESGTNPRLGRHVLSQIVGVFEYADDQLKGYDEDSDVSAKWLDRELGRYVLAGAMARATPKTSADVADEIRRAF